MAPAHDTRVPTDPAVYRPFLDARVQRRSAGHRRPRPRRCHRCARGPCMPKKALLLLAFSTAAVVMTAAGPDPPRVVKAWAALIQSVKALEEYVATKELSAIHNEDAALAVATAVLQFESHPPGRGGQQELAGALKTLGQQLGDLLQAADACDFRES